MAQRTSADARAVLRVQWQGNLKTVDLLITPVAPSLAFLHKHQGKRWVRMLQVNGQNQPHTDSLLWTGYPGVVGLPARQPEQGHRTFQ